MIVVIDNDLDFASMFEKELYKYFYEEEIHVTNKFDYSFVINNDIDVLFLDIVLDSNVNGIELAKKYRKLKGYTLDIVFVSSHDNLVFNAFDIAPTGFIRKMHYKSDLSKCVDVIKSKLQKKRSKIRLNNDFVKLMDILYIETKMGSSYYNLKNREKIKTSERMYQVEKKLENSSFARCHASFIVNVIYIIHLDSKTVELEGGIKIPISRKYKDNVSFKYSDFW